MSCLWVCRALQGACDMTRIVEVQQEAGLGSRSVQIPGAVLDKGGGYCWGSA